MTRDETKQLLMRISSVYPNWKPQAELKYVVETWWEYLSEYSYSEMKMALKAYISTDTNGFAPAPGQLIGLIDRIGNSQEPNEMEAWSLVSNALRRSTYYAESEFDKLPEIVQRAVGSPSMLRNWAQTDMQSVENVVQSNFMRTYRQEVSKNREKRKIPQDVLETLGQSADRMIESK